MIYHKKRKMCIFMDKFSFIYNVKNALKFDDDYIVKVLWPQFCSKGFFEHEGMKYHF